jgi:hypothetical protein
VCNIATSPIGSRRLRGVALTVSVVVTGLAVVASGSALDARRPTLTITSVKVTRTTTAPGYAGTVDLRVRLCASIGPRAVLLTRQWRAVGRVKKASANDIDPLGVDLTKVYPYSCTSDYQMSWIVPTRLLVGGGTYYVSVRVRDGYGRLSAPASFTLRQGP